MLLVDGTPLTLRLDGGKWAIIMVGEVPNEEGWQTEVVETGALEFGNSSDEDKAVSSAAILV